MYACMDICISIFANENDGHRSNNRRSFEALKERKKLKKMSWREASCIASQCDIGFQCKNVAWFSHMVQFDSSCNNCVVWSDRNNHLSLCILMCFQYYKTLIGTRGPIALIHKSNKEWPQFLLPLCYCCQSANKGQLRNFIVGEPFLCWILCNQINYTSSK